MELTKSSQSLTRIRYAVLTIFIAQGLCFSSWASRIPDIKAIFEVDYALLWGMILFLIPVGKFVAIPLAGYLVSKLGSKIMVQVSILGYASTLLLIGLAHNIYLLGAFLFCFGVFWNLCDISLNTQAIGIERRAGKTIMATFHGGWSVGAVLGALIGFVMIVMGIIPTWHYIIITCVIFVAVLINRKYLQNDETASQSEEKKLQKEEPALMSFVKKPEKLLLTLGLLGLFALIVESAMFDWSGVYFEEVIKAPKSLQIGFLVFMIMMAIGRFLTNFAYEKLGKLKVVQTGGFCIFIGFFISSLLTGIFDSMIINVIINSIGFMLVGLGISCMVPTIYSLVGAYSKTPVSIALTILSSISFIGSLIAPILIGGIISTFNMKYAYMVIGVLGLCIVLITYMLPKVDTAKVAETAN
ncbi:MAG: MFS transporter [Bacteroidales bacterium]|nr:MFS transporter [Bacteroidales bacterium]